MQNKIKKNIEETKTYKETSKAQESELQQLKNQIQILKNKLEEQVFENKKIDKNAKQYKKDAENLQFEFENYKS